MTERIVEALNQIAKALSNLANSLSHIIIAIKPLSDNSQHKRVGYNAKYWKITDNRHFDIDLMVRAFGSNEKCYYSKMDR